MSKLDRDDVTKFCRDCKHCFVQLPGQYDVATCQHERARKITADYLVSGIPDKQQFFYASSMRSYESMCGEAGKLWERKT